MSQKPEPYFLFPGTAREALETYHRIFGGELELNTYGEFGRDDGPVDAIAHGILRGSVVLFAADAGPGEAVFSAEGLMLSLLGAAGPEDLRAWFGALAEGGGDAVDPLQERPWGAWDGQVVDRFGVRWLIGWE